MSNFTNLPERHFVDKAKRLSLGDKDSDVYFDGEALEALINTVEDLQEQIEHLPTEAFTTMTITHSEGTAFRVTVDYTELVKAIRERSPILAKVYDRSIPSAVTNYSLSTSTAEDLEEFVIVGQEIVTGVNSVTVNQITVSFPPTTSTPIYSVSITSKQIPLTGVNKLVLYAWGDASTTLYKDSQCTEIFDESGFESMEAAYNYLNSYDMIVIYNREQLPSKMRAVVTTLDYNSVSDNVYLEIYQHGSAKRYQVKNT